MKNRPRGGLGRGLGALIPTAPPSSAGVMTAEEPAGPGQLLDAGEPGAVDQPAPVKGAEPVDESPARFGPELAPVPGARFAEIPVDSIEANPKQPRQVFDEEALDELKASIHEVGFLQPIVVRQLEGDRYELVMGERRWRAAKAIGRESIPAIVRDTRDDAMLRDALLENIHRANLNPLEEAAAYQQLLEEFGATHEELARRIGRSRPQISNTIRLMNLPPSVQVRVAAGELSAGHARALLGLASASAQEELAHRIVAEGLSVRSTEEVVFLANMDETASDDESTKAPAKRRAKPHNPGLSDLAERLSDRFETRVKVDIGQRKGKITIEFATIDDLERIVGVIGMDEAKPDPLD